MTVLREATVLIQVPFCDVDPMQVVWHGNYFKYFDVAREKLFDDAGVDMYRMHTDTGLVFPVTRSQAKHIRPLRFRDQIKCTARVTEAEYRIVVEFEIRLASDGTLCTKGKTEHVTVRLPEGTMELRIPSEIRRALGGGADAG
jgi:acyl-CoA thioester hydrolase